MANINFDPSIIMQGAGGYKPIASGLAGFQAGMGIRSQMNKQRDWQREQRERKGIVEAISRMPITAQFDQGTKEMLMADPDLAQEYFKQKMANQLKIKYALPDNEWIDDPKDADYQIYVEKVTDPNTRMPVMRPVPGMRKKKKLIERITWEKEKLKSEEERFDKNLKFDEKKFNFQMVMDNSKNRLEWASHKIDKTKSNLEIAKKKFEMRSKEEGAKIDYANLERKAKDALNTIDRMIGSKDGAIKQHPGFKTTVGMKGGSLLFGLRSKPFEGSQAANFMALYNKVTGQAFMEAFQGLKGGGQITEIEGEKATQALIEMNVAQDEGAFIDAARRFQFYVQKGMELGKAEKAGKLGENTIPQQSVTPSGYKIRIKQ